MSYLADRNRGKLYDALAAGLLAWFVEHFTSEEIMIGLRYKVDSEQNPDDTYIAEVIYLWAGGLELHCTCPWGMDHSPFTAGSKPCKHAQLALHTSLTHETRIALTQVDRGLGYAVAAGILAMRQRHPADTTY